MANAKPNLSYIAEDLRPLAVPIASVVLDPRNVRTHSPYDLEGKRAILRKFGQRKPIVCNSRTRQVIAGNGLVQAALSMGWEYLAVSWADDDEQKAAAFAIADNQTAETSAWDEGALAAVLQDLETGDAELDRLFEDLAAEVISEPTEFRELEVKPPPSMTWTLIGIPTVRYGEISDAVERIAGLAGVVCETTSNDG